MRRTCFIALLAVSSVWSVQALGKETKWAVWGSTGGSKSGGGSWWAGMQNGATSFFASTRKAFAGGGTSNAALPKKTTGTSFGGRTANKQSWFTGQKPKSRAEGGSSQTMGKFLEAGRPGW